MIFHSSVSLPEGTYIYPQSDPNVEIQKFQHDGVYFHVFFTKFADMFPQKNWATASTAPDAWTPHWAPSSCRASRLSASSRSRGWEPALDWGAPCGGPSGGTSDFTGATAWKKGIQHGPSKEIGKKKHWVMENSSWSIFWWNVASFPL